MKFLKIKLFVIAVIMFAASSAFASISTYDVTVDTSSLYKQGLSGYLYLQYASNSSIASTATVSSFATDGILGAQDTFDVANGSAVTGSLPGSVVFANTNAVNDYNHAITFGNSLSFLVSLSSTTSGTAGAVSTFSLGLFGDALGGTPLLNVSDPNIAGTVALINLNDNGATSAQSLDSTATATPTPLPAAAWLLGSGLMGLVGMRRKKQN